MMGSDAGDNEFARLIAIAVLIIIEIYGRTNPPPFLKKILLKIDKFVLNLL
ncbi:MAG: hypothetical protein J7647_08985 [Cyanobacteria bacterium SBLK]|nr:hypothetical protein [Cyanobacteria bacterium SBLK]